MTFSLLIALAWLAWQTPARAPEPRTLRVTIPEPPASTGQSPVADKTMWYILTRRVVSKAAVSSLQRRLTSMKLTPVTVKAQEDVIMHAFDDAILFKTNREAWAASRIWNSHGIESTVIKAEEAGVYLIGLGRFYQTKYAEGIQRKLDKIGRKYRYQQRTVPIPTWRFTFPASDKQQAEKLWKKLHDTGVIMPVMMPEDRFLELYGESKG